MMKMFSKRLNNKKGFTLIELIVVIAILGILAGIAVPKFAGFKESAQVSAREASIATINKAIMLYCVENDINNLVGEDDIADESAATKIIDFLEGEGLIDDDTTFFEVDDYEYDSTTNEIIVTTE